MGSSLRAALVLLVIVGGMVAEAADYLVSRPRGKDVAIRPLQVGDRFDTGNDAVRRLLPDGSIAFVRENSRGKVDGESSLSVLAGEVYIETPREKGKHLRVKTAHREITGSGGFAVNVKETGTGVVVAAGKVKIDGIDKPLSANQRLQPGKDKIETAPRIAHLLKWTREPMCEDSPLVPGSNFSGGALVALDPNGQEMKLALRKYHIDVHVEDGFARTTIDQTYFNHENQQLEGTFYFPLPPDASLSRLAMYVDGVLMEGGMAERDYARQVYESIRFMRKDPALLEWLDGSTFKMRVFPIEPRQEKRIILSYTQKLPVLNGTMDYRFPAGHSLPAVREWSFRALVKDGAKMAWQCPSHQLTAKEDRDLVLEGSVKNAKFDKDVRLQLSDAREQTEEARFSTMVQDGHRYLMVRYRPDFSQSAISNLQSAIGKHWTVLFETSADRDPLLARAQIEVTRHLLAHADPSDTFTLLTANTRVQSHGPALAVSRSNIDKAMSSLEKSHLIGALDLGQALDHAAGVTNSGVLLHLGSGIPAMGEKRHDSLVKKLPKGTQYIGVGVGRRWNRDFMKLAAERTGGLYAQVNPDEPLAWRAFELMSTLRSPRLFDVQVADAAGETRFLAFNQIVAQGEEIAAVARVPEKQAITSVAIRGTRDGKPFERVLSVKATPEAGHLPRTWAKLEIDRLLAEDVVKHKDAVVALSKAMYVMTPFTSLLVLENDDMYTQYKVDRGRKDHWAMYPCPAKIAVVHEPEEGGVDWKAVKKGDRLPAKVILATIAAKMDNVRPNTTFGAPILSKIPYLERLFQNTPFGRDSAPASAANWTMGLTPQYYGGLGALAGAKIGARNLEGDTGKYMDRYRDLMREGRTREALIFAMKAKELDPDNVAAQAGTHIARVRLNENGWNEGSPRSEEMFRGTLNNDYGLFATPLQSHWSVSEKLRQIAEWRGSNARVGQVIIVGNDVTQDRVIRRQRFFGQPPGEAPETLSLSYRRPRTHADERIFFDLVANAPGTGTSTSDVHAILETEALPTRTSRRGNIDPRARELLAKARDAGWQSLTYASENGGATTIRFDGQGRFAYERELPPGILEKVVCDGKTLWHLYPQLGIGAQRTVSRFHRLDLAELLPWFIPSAEDLAHGADVKMIGDNTVAIIPHVRARSVSEGETESLALHFIFADNGRLTEKRLIRMPKNEVVSRLLLSPEGTITLQDAKGKTLDTQKAKLTPADAPSLSPNTQNLVVLPLPFRTADHVKKSLKITDKAVPNLTFAEALPLFAAHYAAGNGNEANTVFRQVFHAKNQRQLGFYVLLAACGQNLDSQNGDVLAEHMDEPLAHYLALYSSPVLRNHASQWAVSSDHWKDGYLRHLAYTHALLQRWQNEKLLKGDASRAQVEKKRALEYVRKHKGTGFAWSLLCLMQDRAGDDKAFHRELADCWKLFADPCLRFGLGYSARYEAARSLLRAGQRAEARAAFRKLHEETLGRDELPAIDADFRQALLGNAADPDNWGELLRKTARILIEKKHRPAVLALARQCGQLEDLPLANQLLDLALDGVKDGKERLALQKAGVQFLQETGQLAETDALLSKLLADTELAKKPELWRMGAALAEKRGRNVRRLECLEKALDLEFQNLPETINLESFRADYLALLDHYENLAEAMVALKLKPPDGFLGKVVRTVDRWRAVDNVPDRACTLAAGILRRLGGREMEWDYLTTPIASKPNEAGPWAALASNLNQQGELELSDRAYKAAFESEPTNAQILWDRAENLRQSGRPQQARALYRQLAEGTWQERFQGLQNQARTRIMAER